MMDGSLSVSSSIDHGTRAITFDIDWAPDWSIRMCADMCRAFECPATFFVTHKSIEIDRLAEDPLFELGIHPNFLSGSSHGDTMNDVLKHCFEIVPGAASMRTHALYQSSSLFGLVADHYESIIVDASLFLPFHPNLQPTDLYIGNSQRRITRVPYFWEDDLASNWPSWGWELESLPVSGTQVFDFHPIHIALNTNHMAPYSALKAEMADRRLYDASKEEVQRHANTGAGAQTFFLDILQSAPSGSFKTVTEIATAHRQQCA